MSRADRRWRPSDADRDRYASAISEAFAEGRIDAADMESRTALVHEAKSIADLDALVDDMPPPAPAPTHDPPVPPQHRTRRVLLVVAALAFGAIVLSGIIGAVLFNTLGDEGSSSADPPPVAEAPVAEAPVPEEVPPPVDIPLPDVATEKLGLFTEAGLNQLWAAADDVEPSNLSLWPDRATLEIRSGTERRSLDRVEYSGGLLLGHEPYTDLPDSRPDDEVFFSWSDVTPQAVLAAIDGTPAVSGAPAGYVIIDRGFDGEVNIRVYPDGDSRASYVRWDATGRQVLQ
ncbi:DUF1707 SHOCT-like domain-containing protein [Jiangella endophytica]|uniref:DUF1707 SHOCT-like domain-containing protein n=1 Tax=Jiangella endophytica TaxID=1623398 RepID=UPI0018E59309|nr:DUF1707 domain-containing protein [Jiangella endophytica]